MYRVQGIFELIQKSVFSRPADKMDKHLSIRIGMENCPRILHLGAQGFAIRKIAIVA